MFRVFSGNDKRLKYAAEELDPRIHFALVCASSSCPPIDVYTPGNLDKELDISGRTFLNAGGVSIDKDEGRVHLSRIFKWYREDFGGSDEEKLRFVSRYLYDENEQEYLDAHAGEIKIEYQDYDWRLNRG